MSYFPFIQDEVDVSGDDEQSDTESYEADEDNEDYLNVVNNLSINTISNNEN